MLAFTVRIYSDGNDETAREVYAELEAALKKRGLHADLGPLRENPDPRHRKLELAKAFLEDAFRDWDDSGDGEGNGGGQPANHLIRLADERGITESTLRDAKRILKMRSQPRGPGKETLWMPPGSMEEKNARRKLGPDEIPGLLSGSKGTSRRRRTGKG